MLNFAEMFKIYDSSMKLRMMELNFERVINNYKKQVD